MRNSISNSLGGLRLAKINDADFLACPYCHIKLATVKDLEAHLRIHRDKTSADASPAIGKILKTPLDSLVKLEGRLSLADLPDEFVGVVTYIGVKKDKNQRECLFLNIDAHRGQVTQKFTGTMIPTLVEALKKLGFNYLEDVEGKEFSWKKMAMPRGYHRWLPVKLLEETTEKGTASAVCPNCKATAPADAKFCPTCGFKLR
jgi:ribosomal protein L40E